MLGDEPMRGWEDGLLGPVEQKDDVMPKRGELVALVKQDADGLQHDGTAKFNAAKT
jgi:hypothetical protein